MLTKARRAPLWASALVLVAVVPLSLAAQEDSTPVAVATGAPESIDGAWKGGLEVLGQGLEIAITFRSAAGGLSGSIDIPAQGASDVPLEAVSYEAPKVHFELVGGPGLAVFDGVAEGDSIRGEFTQATVAGTFTLGREESPRGADADGSDEAGDGDGGPGD